MKKFILNFSMFTMLVVSMTSCVTTNKGFQSSPVVSRNVNLDPIKADIKVDEEKKIDNSA